MRPDDLDADAFAAVVDAAVAALPAWVREACTDVAFLVDDEASAEERAEHGQMYGLFRGVPTTARGWRTGGTLPATITLFRLPILRRSTGPDDVPVVVRDVLRHEVGHALGMSEERLRELGVR